MINYKLLTPRPLIASKAVKEEMMVDHCTWDNDYKQITQKIRSELLELAHVLPDEYSSASKCIQGVPVFSFIICHLDALKKCERVKHPVYLSTGMLSGRGCMMENGGLHLLHMWCLLSHRRWRRRKRRWYPCTKQEVCGE